MKQTQKSLMEWGKKVDISQELYRKYVFGQGGEFYTIIVKDPKYLIVSDNGHRIAGKDNRSHYIPYGWLILTWENVDKDEYQFNHQRPGQVNDAMPFEEEEVGKKKKEKK